MKIFIIVVNAWYVFVDADAMLHTQRSEGSLPESVISSHIYVSSVDWPQVVLGNQGLYPLSHLFLFLNTLFYCSFYIFHL